MTSTLTLYKNCELTPEHNYIIDSVENYLSGLQPLVINNFQHIKHGLDLKIKVDLPQTEVSQPTYNYASIKNEDDTRTFYYFITNVEWRAQNTVNLTLSIDSLTTFRYKFTTQNWDSRTKIIREHQDRFINTGVSASDSFTALRKIDHEDEGLSGVNTYKFNAQKIVQSARYPEGYLVYATDTTDENSPVNCYLVPDWFASVNFNKNTKIYPTRLDTNIIYVFTNIPGQTSFYVSPSYASERLVECSSANSFLLVNCAAQGGATAAWHLYRIENGNVVTSDRLDFLSDEDYIRFFQYTKWLVEGLPDMGANRELGDKVKSSVIYSYNDSNWPLTISNLYMNDSPYVTWMNVDPGSGEGQSITINPLTAWNLSDPRIIKIVSCPYWLGSNWYVHPSLPIPVWALEQKNFGKGGGTIWCLKCLYDNIGETTFNTLVVDDYTLDYFNVTIPNKDSRFTAQRNKNYESKLYHSSIFKNTYVYDSFVHEIRPEDITTTVTPTLDIKYVQSSNISSRCLFDFKLNSSTYKEYSNFDNILSCDRNNEHPIYNSEYINYIKNGYNYDKKNKEAKNVGNWLSTGIQIAGGVLGLAASSFTGGVSAAAGVSLLTSATASIANNIISDVNAERGIQQRLDDLKNKSASVSTSDDLSLLNYYCDNKLWRFDYKPSTKVENSIYDLFFRTGYAFNSNGVPDRQSRRSFNYVQCEPIFKDENSSDWSIYLDDVKQRFKAGVTFMHRFQIQENGDYIYDFNFNYENWETFICPRSY